MVGGPQTVRDGLRALAVSTVFIFHAGGTWLPGGFLGVDFFLVISGYLITSLLVAEYRQGGRLDLWRFWLRRVRRLIPALLLAMSPGLMPGLSLRCSRIHFTCVSVTPDMYCM